MGSARAEPSVPIPLLRHPRRDGSRGHPMEARRLRPRGISNVYTGNDARTRIVLKELNDKVANVAVMRALGFCVSVEHARYMAKRFIDAGVPRVAVSAETSAMDRRACPRMHCAIARSNRTVRGRSVQRRPRHPRGRHGAIPRPTESATVFLQQLGRGLRLTRARPCYRVGFRRASTPRVSFRSAVPSPHRRRGKGAAAPGRGGFPVSAIGQPDRA